MFTAEDSSEGGQIQEVSLRRAQNETDVNHQQEDADMYKGKKFLPNAGQ